MADPNPLDSELLFGKLVIDQGPARPEHVQECLKAISDLVAGGVIPVPRLGELLHRKGYITSGQLERTMRLSEGPTQPAGPDEASLPE